MPTYRHCSHQNTKVTKLALGIFEYKKFRPYLNKLKDGYKIQHKTKSREKSQHKTKRSDGKLAVSLTDKRILYVFLSKTNLVLVVRCSSK